jgi:phosphohistidine phosphatase
MKTLCVIRHAKSSWDQPGLSDFDRPLNDRGKRDAPRMGKRLKEKGVHPDVMISSPAKRAFSTCKRIAAVLGFAEEKIKTERALYHADEEEILSAVRKINDKHHVAMVFGHNPGLTEFANLLSDKDNVIDNVPTCGVVVFDFKVDSWTQINFGNGEFVFFDFPKSRED